MTSAIPEYDLTRAPGCPFDPPPTLRARHAEGPVTRIRLWDGSTPWLVTGHAENRALLADPRVSVDHSHPGMPRVTQGTTPTEAEMAQLQQILKDRPAPSLSFIMMDEPEHTRLRRMVTATFTVKRMEAMRPAVQKIVDEFIDTMLAGPNPADLVEAFALPVPSLVICELLGVPYSEHDLFQRNSKTIISRASTALQRLQAQLELGEYLDSLLGEKLTNPGDDLLSTLAERVKSGDLQRQEDACLVPFGQAAPTGWARRRRTDSRDTTRPRFACHGNDGVSTSDASPPASHGHGPTTYSADGSSELRCGHSGVDQLPARHQYRATAFRPRPESASSTEVHDDQYCERGRPDMCGFPASSRRPARSAACQKPWAEVRVLRADVHGRVPGPGDVVRVAA